MNFDEFLLKIAKSKLLNPKYISTLIAVFGEKGHGKSIEKCCEEFLKDSNGNVQPRQTTDSYLKQIYEFFWQKHPELSPVDGNRKRKVLTDYLVELYEKQENKEENSDRPQPSSNLENISTATVNDNLPKPSDQEELEIDSFISSWISEKSYNKFIARDFDLKKLIEYTEDDINSKILSIWGMGGLGKTATCHRLVSLLHQQKRFKKIVWINAKRKQFQTSEGKSEQMRESRLDIQDAILDIGKELNLDAWFVQDTDRLQHEITNLFMQESHLLVVDGLEDTESPKLLISNLRKILGKSSLFLTSRKQISLENGFEYRLSELDHQSSYTFIQQMISEKCADDQAIGQQISQNIEKVIAATHGMPLAMKLLVSQSKFLGLERVLERLNSVADEEDFYSYLYWEVYQELCRENQIDVLKILIFLSTQSSLSTPQSWLYDFDNMSKIQIDKAIRVMYQLSLIEVSKHDKEDRQINLHSFTAQYFRETLKEKLSQ